VRNVENNNHIEYQLKNVFEKYITIESSTQSIEALLSRRNLTRTNYSPHYQRNYVWEKDKATYFIESILIGTEIPPLVFFKKSGQIEVIDGRQRFETIYKFVNNEFSLTNKGLNILKELVKKSYNDLDEKTLELFYRTKLRVIEFQLITEIDSIMEDLVKKEIFRRYNSGITPLKNIEVEKAKYIVDDVTKYFKHMFKKYPLHYDVVVKLLLNEKEFETRNTTKVEELLMQEVRELLVMHKIPIQYRSASSKAVIDKFYELFSDEIINAEEVKDAYQRFMKKIKIIEVVETKINYDNRTLAKLVNKCLFWGLSILETEKLSVHNLHKFTDDFTKFVIENISSYKTQDYFFSKQLKERYEATSRFFETYFNINLSLYLRNSGKSKTEINNILTKDINTEEIMGNLETLRLSKPSVSDVTIEEIEIRLTKKKFLVRPVYQREEAINTVKSSAIIESILLGIKLPPIFIFQRTDGIEEVIDGQQRLLSILGFIGGEFINVEGERVKSNKHEFSLTKLRLLTELNGKKFKDLSPELIDRILDFKLYLVEISEDQNPKFDPIDLFIRLNNKPYPIKENSFEMWNSYVDMDIINNIKDDKFESWHKWFYYRQKNTRMDNEELFTFLMYLEYLYKVKKSPRVEILHMYEKGTKIEFRIKSKNEVTKLLNLASSDVTIKNDILDSIKEAKKFIKKVKLLLIEKDVTDNLENYLKEELDSIFNIQGTGRRTMQNFYALWFFITPINLERIKYDRTIIKKELKEMFRFIKQVPSPSDDMSNKEFFEIWLSDFWSNYTSDKRKTKLSLEEKMELIKSQGNTCPICKSNLYFGQNIEVDHIFPIALGGQDTKENLQITHAECNRSKKAAILS
jgi:hypothetical protein